jgi:hypothetical protein
MVVLAVGACEYLLQIARALRVLRNERSGNKYLRADESWVNLLASKIGLSP